MLEKERNQNSERNEAVNHFPKVITLRQSFHLQKQPDLKNYYLLKTVTKIRRCFI